MNNQVVFWNCCGGIKSKIDYIRHFLTSSKPSILFISESEVSIADKDVIKITDYDLVLSNTLGPNSKSRLACYILSSLNYNQVDIGDKLDIIALDVQGSRIVGVYRPFKLAKDCKRSSFFHSIIKTLENLSKTDKMLVIGGDFNVDLFKKSSNLNDLQNWAINNGLIQLVQNYTWRRLVSGNIQTSAIDHLYTNDLNLKLTLVTSVSDHDFLVVSKELRPSERHKTVLRDWRKYSKEQAVKELNKELDQLSINSTENLLYKDLIMIMTKILDRLAPQRVIRYKSCDIVSLKLEKLKKRRDRLFKKFRKTGSTDEDLLAEIKTLNKDIRKCVHQESVRLFQSKAKSPDPKIFWQAVNASLGKIDRSQISLNIDGIAVSDFKKLADAFANFFSDKVKQYSLLPSEKISLPCPQKPLVFSSQEIAKAAKEMKNKKSFGIDKIPQCMLKDVHQYVPGCLVNTFNDFARSGIPDELKVARVLPLHKKGSKTDITNYRPISNLSPFSKLYERCLLSRLTKELPVADGLNQHGFKKHHSTETALLTLQSYMADALDKKLPTLVYSVDLSAAFDLLLPDKFYNLFKDKLSEGMLYCLMDFLQDRKFCVEQGNQISKVMPLDRGCVQGSVLGPRLFSLYVGALENELAKTYQDIKVVSFADDTYVLVQSDTWTNLRSKTEEVLNFHVTYLRSLGMTVNESKTEMMIVGSNPLAPSQVTINGKTCDITTSMRALGITFDSNLKWDIHAEDMINRGKGLISVFRHLRKYLTEEQFLKTVTCNFYSSVYYAASVWLPNCKSIQSTKLTSLHFRLLRTACKDYWTKLSRKDLTNRCQRATPAEWSKYTTASVAIKVIKNKQPTRLHEILMSTYYSERRNAGKGLFYDSSKTVPGRQSIQNRLKHIAQIKEPWNESGPEKFSKDKLRVMLKSTYFLHKATFQAVSVRDCPI